MSAKEIVKKKKHTSLKKEIKLETVTISEGGQRIVLKNSVERGEKHYKH